MKYVIKALMVSLLLVGGVSLLPAKTQPQPAQAAQDSTFDHSNCQYPDRWSNPVDGCDNTDPAVPECIKYFSTKEGEDACIADFVAQHQQPAPVTETKTAQPQEAAQCGGK